MTCDGNNEENTSKGRKDSQIEAINVHGGYMPGQIFYFRFWMPAQHDLLSEARVED
jgi:hypothetical protein